MDITSKENDAEERIIAKLKHLYDEELLKDLNDRRTNRKNVAQKQLVEAKEVIHKVIVDDLSAEWMKLLEGGTSQQHKAQYLLVDQVLPAVIVGLTKLLTEVDRRGLTADSMEPNFNPINFLGQFLMRNNPRHEIFPEQNPYICGMRKVAAQLSLKVSTAEQQRLAVLRGAIERRKMEISMAKLARASEFDQRVGVLTAQFPEWGVSPFDGIIESALIEGAIRAFIDRYEESLTEIYQVRAISFCASLSERIRHSGVNSIEYANLLAKRSSQMTVEVFNLFVSHLTSCAEMYRTATDGRFSFDAAIKIFLTLDAHREGRINREKVLEALRKFYASLPKERRDHFIHPGEWPVCPPEDDVTGEDILSLEMEPPVFEMFEAPPPTPPTEEELLAQGGEGEGEGEAEGEVDPTPILAPEATELSMQPDDEVVKERDTAGEEVHDTEAAVAPAPAPSEAIVNFAEAQLVTATLTIEPVSGDVAVSEDNAVASSAPPKRPGTLPVIEQSAPVSAPVSRPPAQIGTIPDDEESSEALEELADLPQNATSKRLLNKTVKKLEPFDGVTLTQQQFVQTLENFVMPGTVAAEQVSPKTESTGDDEEAEESEEEPPAQREVESALRHISNMLASGYLETDAELTQRLKASKQAAGLKLKQDKLDKLFDRWDNEGQGVIDLDEVENLLSRYKHGQENTAIRTAVNAFVDSDELHSDRRLSRTDFKQLIISIANSLPGPDESFEYLLSFMNNAIKLSLVEQLRGSCRRRWLAEVQNAIMTAGLSLDNVFRAAFQAIYKDAELHGDRKQINVYVALGERVPESERPAHGDGMCLRYVAATPKDSAHVLNKRLYRDMAGVSLTVLDSGHPIHVPRIAAHGNVHFWNPNRPKTDRDGSFLVLPLKETSKKQCFGILGIDTIGDPQSSAGVAGGSFHTHEIKFYQGVAAALADAFRVVQFAVDVTEQLGRAVPLMFENVPKVLSCSAFLTEIDPRTSWSSGRENFVVDNIDDQAVDDDSGSTSSKTPKTPQKADDEVILRKILEGDRMKLKIEQIGNQPARLLREQNLFREYVFNAAATGTTVIKKSYGERRIAIPLRRPSDGRTIAVFDLGIKDPGNERTIVQDDGTTVKKALPLLSGDDRIRIVRILRILQGAVGELSVDFLTSIDGQTITNPKILHAPGGEKITLMAETLPPSVPHATKIRKAVMLDRLMLAFHRAQIRRYYDTEVFSDLRQIGKPNTYVIHQFTAQLVSLAYPKYHTQGALHSDWLHCKVFLTGEMRDRLLAIDPSHPKIASFIAKKLVPMMPVHEQMLPLLVTSRMQLLYDFFLTCQRIAVTCSAIEEHMDASPPVSMEPTPNQETTETPTSQHA